jgi:hypothetical protein|nr:MAG TPA: Tryptophanase operon leader peptide [Caudoviricetes sp.]
MRTITYITDVASDTHLILDGNPSVTSKWFNAMLPGDKVSDLRETLIQAAIWLTIKDQELLASNGFPAKTIRVLYDSSNASVFSEDVPEDGPLYGAFSEVDDMCEAHGITTGYSGIYSILSVMDDLGIDIQKFID